MKKKTHKAARRPARRASSHARPMTRASVPASSALALPREFDIRTLGSLPAELRERAAAGSALAIDGSAVAAIDTAALQLLIAARRAAAARALAFEWRDPSEALRATSRLLGLCAALGLVRD